MKKKKNRNIKMTIAAGLLITPAIVAQAGEVQASETTVAAATAEELLNSFKAVNEESSSTTITTLKNNFTKMSEAEKTILGEDNVALIEAKFEYLAAFAELKTDAAALKTAIDKLITAIDKLTTTNKTLIADTEAASAAYTALQQKINDTSSALSNQATTDTTGFLTTLIYYGDTDGEAFLEKYVTTATLDKIEASEQLVEKIQPFMETFIAPILAAAKAEVTVKADYLEAVTNARAEFDEITDTAFKNSLKIQIVEQAIGVEQFIKNAEADLTKAQAVEDKITAIKENPPTATNFSSKITAIQTEYNKLTALQKAFVSNYSDFEQYDQALAVVTEITNLTKLAANSQDLRDKLPVTEQTYNDLDTPLKNLVVNAEKLTDMLASVEKAVAVEGKINEITIASPTISEARTAYNALTSAEKRYVKKEATDLLTAWEKSSTTAANVTKQITAISSDVFATLADETIADTSKVSTVTSFVSKVRTAEAAYSKIKAKENEPETKEQQLVSNRARLEAIIPYTTIADTIAKLKVTSVTYREDLVAAKTALDSWSTPSIALEADQINLTKLHTFLTGYLTALQDEDQQALAIQEQIAQLTQAEAVKLEEIAKTRAAYNALSANGKKLVTNVTVLTNLEKQYKSALDTVNLIVALKGDAKDFARKTIAAQTAYSNLTAAMQGVVYNQETLQSLVPIAQLMVDIDALRPTATDFKTKLTTAQTTYNTLVPTTPATPTETTDELGKATYRLATEYGPKLVTYQNIIANAASIEAKIEALKSKSGELFMTDLKAVSDEYKKLDANTKRSVSNAKLLTELERDYKASLRVIDLIEKLPAHTDRNFASKVKAAQKAYDRLTAAQKNNVYNYATKLQTVVKAADLINRIEKLRVGSKTYDVDVKAIRDEYSKLSATEQLLVHNISKLAGAEQSVSDAAAVIDLIALAIPTAENYIEKLTAARLAYDSLTSAEKKLVSNSKDLTSRERTVKPILKLDTDILALNPANAKTFISKYKSAQKAYEKLTVSERSLLVNADKLTGDFTTLFNVMDSINSIKNSSKTFVEDTKAARALYNALPANLASQVSNYSLLQDHERNVEGGAAVDAMIRSLNASEPKDFIANVKAAREAYKALTSTNKKAVTLEPELKAQEAYIKPIEAAITAIDGLSNPRVDLNRQYTTVTNALKKLDEKQKNYVTNIDQFSNLSNVLHVYVLISNLKANDKYFLGNLDAAKIAYDRLSEQEKLKVTNYYQLQQAIVDMADVSKVSTIIASLNASSSTYFTDITNALAAYKALPSSSKKQVLNYSLLQQAEKDMKAAEKVVKQIDELDATLRTYESKAKAAQKAYERLTVTQKSLVNNYNKLQAAVFELGL